MNNVVIDGDENAPLFIFAHGAGADMNHEFMEQVTKGLVDNGIRVVRFNFPYMVKRAEDGKRRPPDRAPKLLEAYEEVINQYANQGVVIGGKSMGGRMATLLNEHPAVNAIACLGFPFHPPGKPEKYKGEHLSSIEKPCLILQGERDTFGHREECRSFVFSQQVQVTFIPDGDHSFKPRKSSGYTERDNIELAVKYLSEFILESQGLKDEK